MYAIQGAYLYRGFMMEPIYWRIQLTKFHPNINMYMNPENRKFLDNLILSTDQLYGNEAAAQQLDALDKQQFKTISNKFDETRRELHPDIKNKIQDITYNYSPLIEYYYDLSAIKASQLSYDIIQTIPSNNMNQFLSTTSPIEFIGYEDSAVYKDWVDNRIEIGDFNFNLSDSDKPRIKTNGPKEPFDPILGKYVVIEGYKNIAFKSTDRRDIKADGTTVKFRKLGESSAIIYKKTASTVDTPNMTFCNLINFNKGTQDAILFKGYDDYLQKGLIISCHVEDTVSGSITVPVVTIYVMINTMTYSFPILTPLSYNKWYAILIPVSAQYGQLEVNVYSFQQDPANIKNYNKIIPVYNKYEKTGIFEFTITANWAIPNSNCLLANIRLFNTMIQTEDHEFVISQLFVRDESVLAIIDNARPRLNAPFIAINR
jgi:hypothetical protein